MSAALLSVEALHVSFLGTNGTVRVIDGVDLSVREGEVLGIVGESGSGKSRTLRAIVRLIRPPGRIEGIVAWRGEDLLRAPGTPDACGARARDRNDLPGADERAQSRSDDRCADH
jgi:ABC-type glutathione transport system ATPase component